MKRQQENLICDIHLTGINFSLDQLPEPTYHKTNKCYDISHLTKRGSDNFWYEPAVHLLNNPYFQHIQENEKTFVPVDRNTLVNTKIVYGNEDKFIAEKILPNVERYPDFQ